MPVCGIRINLATCNKARNYGNLATVWLFQNLLKGKLEVVTGYL